MKTLAGRGGLSVLPMRRTTLIASAVLFWLVLQLSLVVWWATVILRQARQIAQLQAQSTGNADMADVQWTHTRLMLVGESGAFLAIVLGVSLLLAWFYWREQRRARSMQAFFASVTHELRTPLTSIRLQAEAIAEGEGSAELARRLLEDSHRLESQIDKTLELARIEGGGPLAEQAIPLRPWLERTLASITATHGDRLIVQTQLDEALPPVLADAGALQMIVRNLVENSVRHSGVAPVTVTLHAAQQGATIALDYADNGTGATAGGTLGALFARGPDSSGVGVGLYLVRRLMQRMGGSVEFHSAPGAGFRSRLLFRVAS